MVFGINHNQYKKLNNCKLIVKRMKMLVKEIEHIQSVCEQWNELLHTARAVKFNSLKKLNACNWTKKRVE